VTPPSYDPANSVTTIGAGWATGFLNGRWFSAPIYVDAQGFVRVRLPAVMPPAPDTHGFTGATVIPGPGAS
jgi:hypothetical protein